MVKIITAMEARLIKDAMDQAIEILNGEGYEDEALELSEALQVLKGLQEKTVEEALEDTE